ncbi:MAG: ATP/GTP-binding protein [Thermoplasmata archaeon]|nr:ATP/GTP-binding protein [Thermoplasmata archaeon]
MHTFFFVGTAGAGKSSLVAAFQQWLDIQKYDSIIVNLDPGAEVLKYAPDIDIREWISIDEIMREHELGPNGAQIVAADMLAMNVPEVRNYIEKYGADYVLVDTPGQIELFAFREASKHVADGLSSGHSLLVYLLDPTLAKTPTGLVSLLMLGATIQYRFRYPLVNVLSKCDLLSTEEIEKVVSWCEEPYRLYEAISRDARVDEILVNTEFFKSLENLGVFSKIIPTSSIDLTGMEDVFNTLQQVYMGGDDFD